MINSHKLSFVLCIFLLLTAGCVTEESSWSLDMAGHDEKVENGYNFNGSVRLGGHYSGVSVKDVHVTILDAQNETLEIVSIGTLNVSRSTVEINATLEKQPKYVLVFVGEVVAPGRDNTESGVSGLERVESGDYHSYTAYDPYRSVNETTA